MIGRIFRSKSDPNQGPVMMYYTDANGNRRASAVRNRSWYNYRKLQQLQARNNAVIDTHLKNGLQISGLANFKRAVAVREKIESALKKGIGDSPVISELNANYYAFDLFDRSLVAKKDIPVFEHLHPEYSPSGSYLGKGGDPVADKIKPKYILKAGSTVGTVYSYIELPSGFYWQLYGTPTRFVPQMPGNFDTKVYQQEGVKTVQQQTDESKSWFDKISAALGKYGKYAAIGAAIYFGAKLFLDYQKNKK